MAQQWDILISVASGLAPLVTMAWYLWKRLEDGPENRYAGRHAGFCKGHRQAQTCFLLFPLEDRVPWARVCAPCINIPFPECLRTETGGTLEAPARCLDSESCCDPGLAYGWLGPRSFLAVNSLAEKAHWVLNPHPRTLVSFFLQLRLRIIIPRTPPLPRAHTV